MRIRTPVIERNVYRYTLRTIDIYNIILRAIYIYVVCGYVSDSKPDQNTQTIDYNYNYN